MSQPMRFIVWTDESCSGCGRPAYERRDGKTYLYRYADSAPVCSPKCVSGLQHPGFVAPRSN